jgi:hypothetical protein
MASIKDSFDEVLQDDKSIIKCVLLALPLYYCTDLLMQKADMGYFTFIALVTGILLLGVALKCTQNVRKGQIYVLPSFNVFGILFEGIKGLIALSPLIILAYAIEYFIIQILNNIFAGTDFLNPFIWVTSAICSSIIYTGYLLYAKNFKILDAYNFVSIGKYCIDVLVAIIFMKIKLIFVDLIILVPVTYIVWLFFGIPHPIAIFLWCVVAAFNIAMIGHYLAQTDYEIIGEADKSL